ncbi:hypothetical protein AB0E54_10415 [Amycolatopsis coloradensis]
MRDPMPGMPKVALYAAIRRDARGGYVGPGHRAQARVGWFTMRRAPESAWPHPRKTYPRRNVLGLEYGIVDVGFDAQPVRSTSRGTATSRCPKATAHHRELSFPTMNHNTSTSSGSRRA